MTPHADPVERSLYHKEYRAKNTSTLKEKHRQYRIENAEKIKEKKRQDYLKNAEAYKARARANWDSRKKEINAKRRSEEYREKKRAQRHAKGQKSWQEHLESIKSPGFNGDSKAAQRAWRERNKERINSQKRQAWHSKQAPLKEAKRKSLWSFNDTENCWQMNCKGHQVLLDEDLANDLDPLLWECRISSGKPYFRTVDRSGGITRTAYLHRIAAICPPEKQVDHINGNTLDNRRQNLRVCTAAQNVRNRKVRKDSKSGFKGVYCCKNAWTAQIHAEGKRRYLGSFDTAEDAARAYNEAAKTYYGEFAKLNAIP